MKDYLVLVFALLELLQPGMPAKAKPVVVEYTPLPDATYWNPGGHVFRTGPSSDPLSSPQFREYIADLTRDYVNLKITGMDPNEPQNEHRVVKGLLDDLGLRFTYVQDAFHVTYVFIAYTDTQLATNIPPILGSACDVTTCSDPNMSWEWRSYYPVEDLMNFHKPTEIEDMFDDFLAQFQELQDTFTSLDDVKDTACERESVMRDTLTEKILALDEECATFMESPGRYGRIPAEGYLKKMHNNILAKLLTGLTTDMCKKPVKEKESKVDQSYNIA